MIDFSKHERLASLDGFPFPVRVSAGAEGAAGRMATRCARAYHFLNDTFDFEPRVALLVLTRLDWAKRATIPAFGLPHTRAGNLIVPGEPSDFYHGLVDLLRAGPPWVWDEACRVYGVSDGVPDLSVFLELIAVHELAHNFHNQVPYVFPRLWLAELFVNFCLHAYIATVEPDQLPILETVPRMVVALDPSLQRYRSLTEFEAYGSGVGPINYAWYQAHLHIAAKRLYDAEGISGLQRLWHAFVLPNDQLASMLEQRVHPLLAQVLTEWPGTQAVVVS